MLSAAQIPVIHIQASSYAILCSCMYSKRAKFGNTLLLFMVFENLRKIFKFSFFYVSQVPHMSFGRFEVLKESLKKFQKESVSILLVSKKISMK